MKGKTLNLRLMLIAASTLLYLLLSSCSKEISTTEPASAPQKGNIFVSSNPPGSKIFLNNANTGKITPDSLLGLDVGSYSVTLKSDTYLDTTFTVKLDSGKKEKVYCDYTISARNFATIECISSPANADIYLNDVSTGKSTPATLPFLKPGDYTVTYKIPQFRDNGQKVTLASGAIKKVELALQDTSVWVDYNPDNSDFPDFNVHSVAVDDNDVLWIGTKSRGLIKYTGGKTYTSYTYANSQMRDSYVTKIRKDPLGRLWVLCSFSIVMIDHGVWNVFTSADAGLNLDNPADITFDSKNNPWILRYSGTPIFKYYVVTFDGKKWKNVISDLGTTECIALDNQDKLWLSNSGLKIYDSSHVVLDYTYTSGKFDKFPHAAIESLNWINNKMYLGCTQTSGGIVSSGGVFYSSDGQTFNELSLQKKSLISSIVPGRNGNIWITCGSLNYSMVSTSGAVLKVSPSGISSLYTSASTGTLIQNCIDITTRSNGDVYIATIGGGLVKFKSGDKK